MLVAVCFHPWACSHAVEFGSPADLLRNPTGAFTSMVNQTGPAASAFLRQAAFDTEARRRGGESLAGLPPPIERLRSLGEATVSSAAGSIEEQLLSAQARSVDRSVV